MTPMQQAQLDLDTADSLEKRFQTYHESNPHVYDTLVRLARQMKARGHKHIGIKMLFEVARFEILMNTSDPEGWKLNNNYTSRYARLIMQRELDLTGVFETRELRS